MKVLKESEAKDKAMRLAKTLGHEMRPWRRHQGYYLRSRSSCVHCGHALIVNSGMLSNDAAERMLDEGKIIGRWERSTSGVDFTYAEGSALAIRCRS